MTSTTLFLLVATVVVLLLALLAVAVVAVVLGALLLRRSQPPPRVGRRTAPRRVDETTTRRELWQPPTAEEGAPTVRVRRDAVMNSLGDEVASTELFQRSASEEAAMEIEATEVFNAHHDQAEEDLGVLVESGSYPRR